MKRLTLFLCPFLSLAFLATTQAQEVSLGSDAVAASGSLDGWNSNMVIREEAIYVNNTTEPITVTGKTFEVGIGNARSVVTPFLVQINDVNLNGDFTDDNDFQVVSIGTTRVSGADYDASGVFSFPYSTEPFSFTLPPGAALGAAFMDSFPDGTGGEAGSAVPFEGGAPVGSMWYAGNSGTTHPNPIAIGTVLNGGPAAGVENRNYQFSIDVTLGEITDADEDGIPASFEELHDFLSDSNPADAVLDEDSDDSTNLEEYNRATILDDPDTDDDGVLDGHETNTGIWVSETDTGTNPKNPDTDNDSLPDGAETNDNNFVSLSQTGTDPHLEDSDADGWGDREEISFGSDPNDPANFPSLVTMGTGDVPPSGGAVDGWLSNLIIDEARGYTNTSGRTEVVIPTHFRFTVGLVRSRVTPLIVKLNDLNGNGDYFDDNDFTVMAIGTTRVAGDDYTSTGRWIFTFDEANGDLELEDGERIAPAFIDADPDGLNGEEGSVIPYTSDVTPGEMWYNGVGTAPHLSPPTPLSLGGNLSGLPSADVDNRNYFFQIAFETSASTGGLQITSIDYEDDSVTLVWTSKPGRTYAVEYLTDVDTGWIEQTNNVPSGGDVTSFVFPAGAVPGFPDLSTFPRMLFRVREVSP